MLFRSVLSQFFFQNRLTDLGALSNLKDELAQCQKLNVAVQDFLRTWSLRSEKRNPAVMLDQAALPWFAELNRSLTDTLDDAQFRQRIRASTLQLQALAHDIAKRACTDHPGLDASAMLALAGAPVAGDQARSETQSMLLATSERPGAAKLRRPATAPA